VRGVPRAIGLGRVTVHNINQYLFWAFAYNVLLIQASAGILYSLFAGPLDVPKLLQLFLGEYGFLNPIVAAMALSSLTVIANALRPRRVRVG
jgi:P-type Cu+ transporter